MAGLKKGSFIYKLLTMLNEPSWQHMIRWNTDGKSFVVIHSEEFGRKVLSKLFKHSNFSSFVRQLHLYGFSKNTMGSGSVEFSNAYFLKGREDLLDRISRKNVRPSHEEINNPSTPAPVDEGDGMLIDCLKSQVEELKEQNRMLLEDNTKLRLTVESFQGGSEWDMKLDSQDEAGFAGFPLPIYLPNETAFDSMTPPPLLHQNSFEQVKMEPSTFLPENLDIAQFGFGEAGSMLFSNGGAFEFPFEEYGFGL